MCKKRRSKTKGNKEKEETDSLEKELLLLLLCCYFNIQKIPISVIESKIFISLRLFQINRFLPYCVNTNLAYKPLTPFLFVDCTPMCDEKLQKVIPYLIKC